jgi:fibronectin type 3 domain-containing protein
MRHAIWFLGLVCGLSACNNSSSNGPETVFDTDAPPSPRSLSVERIGDGEVWLSWEPVIDEGVTYIVYRSASNANAAAVDSTSESNFRDNGLPYDDEYTYFVTAMDLAGNESLSSNPVSGQPFNTLSPLAPTGVRATAHNITILNQLDVVVDWNENAETDLQIYRVYRSRDRDVPLEQEALVAEVDKPRYVDTEIEVGRVYYYRITAVDRGSKESVGSLVVRDAALSLPALRGPIEGELTSATPQFRWQEVSEAVTYRVIVTSSPTSGEVSDMPLTDLSSAVFVGRSLSSKEKATLASGQVYYWKVVASTREDGLENAVSRVESFKIR